MMSLASVEIPNTEREVREAARRVAAEYAANPPAPDVMIRRVDVLAQAGMPRRPSHGTPEQFDALRLAEVAFFEEWVNVVEKLTGGRKPVTQRNGSYRMVAHGEAIPVAVTKAVGLVAKALNEQHRTSKRLDRTKLTSEERQAANEADHALKVARNDFKRTMKSKGDE